MPVRSLSPVRLIWGAAPPNKVMVSKRQSSFLILCTGLTLMLLIASKPLFCQTLESLIVDFTRRTVSAAGDELVSGTIYFKAPEDVVIIVDSPVLQWSIFEGPNLLIYYPLEHRAFRFISRNRLMIPFAQSFIGLVREDFGLSQAGFFLQENRKRADILITVWRPPRTLRSYIGEAWIGTQKHEKQAHPFFLELHDPEGNLLTRITYLDYREDLQPSFPGKVLILQKGEDGEVRDEIRYSDHRINAVIPAEVAGFDLPPDVSVDELKW
jgi:hypothetical protein